MGLWQRARRAKFSRSWRFFSTSGSQTEQAGSRAGICFHTGFMLKDRGSPLQRSVFGWINPLQDIYAANPPDPLGAHQCLPFAPNFLLSYLCYCKLFQLNYCNCQQTKLHYNHVSNAIKLNLMHWHRLLIWHDFARGNTHKLKCIHNHLTLYFLMGKAGHSYTEWTVNMLRIQ